MRYIKCKVKSAGGAWDEITLDHEEWAGVFDLLREGDMIQIIDIEELE